MSETRALLARHSRAVCLAAVVLAGFSAVAAAAQGPDAQFLNAWAAEGRQSIPSRLGNFELTTSIARCPAGCEQKDNVSYLLMGLRATDVARENTTIAQIEQSLKPQLLKGYCTSEAKSRNATLGVFVDDKNRAQIGNFWIYASDCASSDAPAPAAAPQSDVQFLNRWAAETREKLPKTVGYVELASALSYCPSGCEHNFGDTYLAIKGSMPGRLKESITLDELAGYLRSQMLKDYCSSDGRKRGLTLRFHIYDMNKVLTGDVGLSPGHCPAK